ncbi:AHH domain-containing protein [Microbulbifer sp. ANSA003]|uniref:AHH domain-containing protein n=1 Tax=Microbulbifer sp. ANSA003 TaxID=3243360 RepID=UPI0040425E34
MGHYEQPKPFYLKDRREVAIDMFVSKDNITKADYIALKVVEQVEAGLDKYRKSAEDLDEEVLLNEAHDSAKLGRYMERNGKPHPGGNCDAHAIVSGSHPMAVQQRAILAYVKIRIDDIRNGTWLPSRTADTPHPKMPLAVPHSRIHRNGYYEWLQREFDSLDLENLSADSVEKLLKGIEYDLKFSTFPNYVMLPADELKRVLKV